MNQNKIFHLHTTVIYLNFRVIFSYLVFFLLSLSAAYDAIHFTHTPISSCVAIRAQISSFFFFVIFGMHVHSVRFDFEFLTATVLRVCHICLFAYFAATVLLPYVFRFFVSSFKMKHVAFTGQKYSASSHLVGVIYFAFFFTFFLHTYIYIYSTHCSVTNIYFFFSNSVFCSTFGVIYFKLTAFSFSTDTQKLQLTQ